MSTYFSNIFGHSPIGPMQDHILKVYECAAALIPFFDAVAEGDWAKAKGLQDLIAQLENEADDKKKDIRLNLPNGLFMPVSRPDILELLVFQDAIANRAKDIAGLVLGRKMELPKELKLDYIEFLSRCVDACAKARDTITELDELVATGFRGSEVEFVQSIIVKLENIENETDSQQVKIRSTLYSMETSLPPIEVIFLYKVIEWTGDLADLAQSVGHRLELMLAR